jgi:hypothetical protein
MLWAHARVWHALAPECGMPSCLARATIQHAPSARESIRSEQ